MTDAHANPRAGTHPGVRRDTDREREPVSSARIGSFATPRAAQPPANAAAPTPTHHVRTRNPQGIRIGNQSQPNRSVPNRTYAHPAPANVEPTVAATKPMARPSPTAANLRLLAVAPAAPTSPRFRRLRRNSADNAAAVARIAVR